MLEIETLRSKNFGLERSYKYELIVRSIFAQSSNLVIWSLK
jgi:hypothetical protein